jgi:predicted PhzF superfamily epimerase YddE/YHI9
MSQAHGIQPGCTGKNRFGNLIEVLSEHEVRNIAPDFSGLSKIPMRGVIVTSRASTQGLDFVSWFFAPSVGVNEDPVTGSAHCRLAQYWQKKLKKKYTDGVPSFGTGCMVKIRLDAPGRATIAGTAVTVWKGLR